MPQESLFRQKAVDRMLSPDELDRLMRVVDPRGWLALIALFALLVPAGLWAVFGSIPAQVNADDGILLHRGALHGVVSQASGIVTDVLVDNGDVVQPGEVVARVSADRAAEATEVTTLFGGQVVDVPIGKGMLLSRGQLVAVVEEGNEPLQAVFFVPAEEGKQLNPGMQVHVSPSTTKAEEFGYLQGTVLAVSQLPVSEGDMLKLLQDQSLVDALREGNNQLEVSVKLVVDSATPAGSSGRRRRAHGRN